MEAEAIDVSESSGLLNIDARTMGLGSVLNNKKAISFRQVQKPVHRGRFSIKVYWKDGARVRRDGGGYLRFVDQE